jgi:hypothetical protein
MPTNAITGVTLGQVCAAEVVFLDVACYQCARKGRYRITRLIDRHGAGTGRLCQRSKDELAADCPKRHAAVLPSVRRLLPEAAETGLTGD